MFGEEHPNPHYSLEAYHIMGSCILSRSFQVEALSTTDGVDASPTSVGEDAEMSMDEPSSHALDSDEIEDDDDSDDDDSPANVAMVPMADMLNARYGCDNVRVHRP